MTTTQLTGTAAPAPRWAVRAAHAAALLTLPCGIWRLLLAAGQHAGYTDEGYLAAQGQLGPGWGAVYLIALSAVSELAALLTLGLVRPWGEVLPRWIPVLGGRAVPERAAVVSATVGVVLLTCLWTPFLLWWSIPHPDLTPLGHTLIGFVYLPQVAWAPLLAAVTVSYHRRRRAARG
ncbi:hypothetical protein F4556_005807 [Kitasatospora gansuensis]|uniref:Uncharacterized protein n=1 Tax=Kitasatospora gansuensis TaxID=258050 RepID=A0A7W7SHQ5_9ACTN|nr:hypothetical protein [Kitasatospora gansuensis]MBB4950272.1 hypothetical protein [Kitasatospora gansuensis]